jgi:hypothetical protein
MILSVAPSHSSYRQHNLTMELRPSLLSTLARVVATVVVSALCDRGHSKGPIRNEGAPFTPYFSAQRSSSQLFDR